MIRVLCLTAFIIVSSLSAAYAADEDVILATFDGGKITMADFNRIVGYYDKEKREILETNPQYRKNMLQRFVQGFIISKIAREKGFDKRPDISEQVNLYINDYLTTQYIKDEVVGTIDTKDEDLKQYYQTHQDEFKTPEQARARHILVRVAKTATETEKKAAKEKIEGLLKRIREGADFGKLAEESSEDPGSKAKGGDLGFFSKGRMVPVFEKAVFALKPGEVSDIVETQFGFHVIKMEEKKESVVEPFDKVKDKVKDKVVATFREARVTAFLQKAMTDANAKFNLEPLAPAVPAPAK